MWFTPEGGDKGEDSSQFMECVTGATDSFVCGVFGWEELRVAVGGRVWREGDTIRKGEMWQKAVQDANDSVFQAAPGFRYRRLELEGAVVGGPMNCGPEGQIRQQHAAEMGPGPVCIDRIESLPYFIVSCG
jgi:hypothetical protein